MNFLHSTRLLSLEKLFFTVLLWCTCSTARPQSWTELGPKNSSNGSNGDISSLVVDDTGNVYAPNLVYSSNLVNGANLTNLGVSKWNGKTWNLLTSANNSLIYNIEFIYSLAFDQSGNLYAAGEADKANIQKNTVLKWDGSIWSALGTGFGNGIANTNPNYSAIYSIKTDHAGNVYAAGHFTNSRGTMYVAKWDGKSWIELGAGTSALNANGSIEVIEIDHAGNIYAGGGFTNTQRNPYVAKWDGTKWSELGGNTIFGTSIKTLFADPFGNIYAGGVLGISIGPGFLLKWNGSVWETPGTLNVNGEVNSIIGDSAGNIYAGGTFTDSTGYIYVAKWNGLNWSEVGTQKIGTNITALISSMALSCSGNIYAAGGIVGTTSNSYVVQFPLHSGNCVPPACPISFSFSYPDTLSVCADNTQQLSVTAPNMQITWYKDGLSWKKDSTSVSTNAPGYYKVQLTNCNGLTRFTDSVYVNIIDISVSLGNDTTFCEGQLTPIVLRADAGYTEYIWNHTEGTGNTFTAFNSGIYILTVVNSYGCTGSDTILLHNYCPPFFIPNLVTPNNDAKNDTFLVANLLPQCSLQIYNSWGEEVYKNMDYNNSWSGENLSDGVYFYMLQNKYLKKSWKGWVQTIH